MLLVFTLYCGGRILLYFECKFTNTITSATCDCANILTDKKTDNTNTPLAHHNHKHNTEEFELTEIGQPVRFLVNHNDHAIYWHVPQQGFNVEVFHPPV